MKETGELPAGDGGGAAGGAALGLAVRKRSGRSGRVPQGRCTLPGSTVTAWTNDSPPAAILTVVVPALKGQKRPERESVTTFPLAARKGFRRFAD